MAPALQDSSSKSINSLSSENFLTWQSALWALVPIALNTMTQPSGRFREFPSPWSFVVRSSPIFCAFATLDSLWSVVEFFLRNGSLKGALRNFVAERFSGSPDDAEGSFASLRKNTIFRIGLFVIGALPQIVKIFATKGIPLTQVACAAYLSTFVVDEVLLALAPTLSDVDREHWETRADDLSSLPRDLVFWIGFLVSAMEPFVFAGQRLSPSELDGNKELFLYVVSVLANVCTISLIVWDTSRAKNQLLSGIFCFSLAFMVWQSVYNGIESASRSIIEHTLSSTSLLVALAVVQYIDLTGMIGAYSIARLFNMLTGICYVLLQLLAALFYYWKVYDPTTSFKPAWTEWLG